MEYDPERNARFQRKVILKVPVLGLLENDRETTPSATTNHQRQRRYQRKTRPAQVNIGQRRKPRPKGRPGFVRVDPVHQGDQDGIKGLYYINAVDEVTQMQVVVSVEKISERCLPCWTASR